MLTKTRIVVKPARSRYSRGDEHVPPVTRTIHEEELLSAGPDDLRSLSQLARVSTEDLQ